MCVRNNDDLGEKEDENNVNRRIRTGNKIYERTADNDK